MTIARPGVVLDPESPTPLYHQIALGLRARIDNGELRQGDQIPSERILAESLGVSRMTVRQAIGTLIREGHCVRIRGRGIFVRARPIIVDSQSFEGFTASMRRAGRSAETRLLGKGVSTPPDWVREGLEITPDAEVYEFTRLRLIEGQPAIIESEWFPAAQFPGLLDADLSGSLFAVLEGAYGVYVASTVDLIIAYTPTKAECDLLGLDRRVSVIARDRIGREARGRPIEAVRSIYNPRHYEFRMVLQRASAPIPR